MIREARVQALLADFQERSTFESRLQLDDAAPPSREDELHFPARDQLSAARSALATWELKVAERCL